MPNELPIPNLDNSDSQLTSNQSENQKSARNNPAEELLVWDAPGRVFNPKSAQWFLSLFAVGLVFIVGFAIIREFWLILLTASIVFVYYALHRVEPNDIEHRILSTGVEVGGRLYAWDDLKSFWILNDTDPAILCIETKLFLPHLLELVLPKETPDEDLKDLKQLLVGYIPAVAKPHSEAGSAVDDAIMSVYGIIPFRGKMTNWLGNRLDIK